MAANSPVDRGCHVLVVVTSAWCPMELKIRRYVRFELAFVGLFVWGVLHIHRSHHSSSDTHAHSVLHHIQLQRERQIVGRQISKAQFEQDTQIKPHGVHLPTTKEDIDKLTAGVNLTVGTGLLLFDPRR